MLETQCHPVIGKINDGISAQYKYVFFVNLNAILLFT